MNDKTTEAMTSAQKQAEAWTPAAFGSALKLWFDPSNPWASVQEQAEPNPCRLSQCNDFTPAQVAHGITEPAHA